MIADRVLKGAAVVGAGVKTAFMFKKTVAMGAVAMVATAVGKVRAPGVTNKVLDGGKKVLGEATSFGSALYRGVQRGMKPKPVSIGPVSSVQGSVKA